MPTIQAKQDASGGYFVKFRHPLHDGKVKSYGLATKDETQARNVCRDVRLIFDDKVLLANPTVEDLVGYDELAINIVFGAERAAELSNRAKGIKQALDKDDAARIERALRFAGLVSKIGGTSPEQLALVKDALMSYTPKSFRILTDICERQAIALKLANEELVATRSQLARLHAKHNIQVKATMDSALEAFKEVHEKKVSVKTFKVNVSYIEAFIESLARKGVAKLGEVDHKDVDGWLERVKGAKKQELGPRSLVRRRCAVSKFFSWAMNKYSLDSNPVRRCLPIETSRIMDVIVAIDRLSELQRFIKALKPHPYWQAWVATAVLAGPRYSEQVNAKIGDVYLDEDGDYIKWVGKKTGRVRRVAIEQTTLLPIIKDHVERRRSEQRKKNATEGQKSDLLFPTLTGAAQVEREKSAPGSWSDRSNFNVEWTKLVAKVGSRRAKDAASAWLETRSTERATAKREKRKVSLARWESDDLWEYGPREWRHTFGTVLAHCGFTSLEISRFMGNSPAVADRHYIKSASSGADSRWPFKW